MTFRVYLNTDMHGWPLVGLTQHHPSDEVVRWVPVALPHLISTVCSQFLGQTA